MQQHSTLRFVDVTLDGFNLLIKYLTKICTHWKEGTGGSPQFCFQLFLSPEKY